MSITWLRQPAECGFSNVFIGQSIKENTARSEPISGARQRPRPLHHGNGQRRGGKVSASPRRFPSSPASTGKARTTSGICWLRPALRHRCGSRRQQHDDTHLLTLLLVNALIVTGRECPLVTTAKQRSDVVVDTGDTSDRQHARTVISSGRTAAGQQCWAISPRDCVIITPTC